MSYGSCRSLGGSLQVSEPVFPLSNEGLELRSFKILSNFVTLQVISWRVRISQNVVPPTHFISSPGYSDSSYV